MRAYENLAPYYDTFMDFMEYDDEAKGLHYLIESLGAEKILDLGAGSGGHLLPLLRNGHRVDALDISPAMLEVLEGKIRYQGLKAKLFEGDMTSFSRKEGYEFIYALGDTVHHLPNFSALEDFLSRSFNNLVRGGHLVFTYRQPEYFQELVSVDSFYETHGNDYLLWQIKEAGRDMVSILYTAFIQEQENGYSRIEETHTLQIYTPKQINQTIIAAGFKLCPDLAEKYLIQEWDNEEFKVTCVLIKP